MRHACTLLCVSTGGVGAWLVFQAQPQTPGRCKTQQRTAVASARTATLVASTWRTCLRCEERLHCR